MARPVWTCTALGPGVHLQRMDDGATGGGDPLQQAVLLVVVHQEADRAPVHAVDGRPAGQVGVQGLQHEAVAAQGHDDIGLCVCDRAVALGQPRRARPGPPAGRWR